MDTRHIQFVREVAGTERLPRGADLLAGGECLRIEFMREDVLRLQMTRGGQWDTRPRLALSPDFQPGSCPVSVAEDSSKVCIKSSCAEVVVWKKPFHIEARRADGSALFSGGRDEQGRSLYYGDLNEEFTVNRIYAPGDAIYGLGEKTGHANRRGRSFTLWNTDVLNPNAFGDSSQGSRGAADPRGTAFDPYYMAIPFFQHQTADGKAAGFFIDNAFRGEFAFSDGADYSFRFSGGHYTEYVFAGPSLAQVLEAYTWVTGRMNRPPMWALGHHQSRWAQYTAAEFAALGQTYREKGIPCDSLWFDINHMKDYQVFTWNPELVPDPSRLLREVADDGFRTVTIVDPGISATKGYAVFEEGVARDAFCRTESGSLYNGSVWPGKTVFPDFVRTEVRTWWAEQIAGHLNKGLSGIWNDMNEPSSNIPLTGMRFDRGAVLHERHHNEYALLMGLATLEGAYAAQPGQRPFILSRAGSAGIQRVAANWSGDNCARWEHLWMSIPMLTGIGLSGQPFTGADIPGFFENPDPELMVRWYQAGAFYPFCRNHSCNWGRERYPWSFGPAVEKVVREALRRRYQLLPYIYTAFVQASETGAPVMRPLVFDFQYDDAARETDDQFMLGESLMIAPVCQPGRTSRQVYLPEGWWYDWRDSALLEGGRFITAAAPMDSIPVYARAGCMIPLWPEPPQTTMNYQPEAIELRVFVPPANGVFTARLIEDDGITLEYQQGKQFDTQFKMVREKNRLILRGTTRGESFDGFKRRHFRIVPVGAPLDPVTCAAAPSFEHSWNL